MTIANKQGFTLIEVLVAIVILGVGLLTLMTMQVTGIKGNATAERITLASDWGVDQIEQLFALDYDHDDLRDDNSITNASINPDGAAGLDSATDADNPDGKRVSPDGLYTVYWNVAEDQVMPNTKSLRVIVLRTVGGSTKSVTMNYLKAKYL